MQLLYFATVIFVILFYIVLTFFILKHILSYIKLF